VKVSDIIFYNYLFMALFDIRESTVLRAPGPILTILDSHPGSYVYQCLEIMYARCSCPHANFLTLPALDRSEGPYSKISQVVHRDGKFLYRSR